MRFQNYFIVNEKQYYTGTIIIVKNMGREVEAAFVCYDTEYKRYVYRIKECNYHMLDSYFWDVFVSVTDKVNDKVHVPTIKTKNDTHIEGLSVGWTWYVVLMLVSVVFKEVIGLWIFISIVFFDWRSKKIKKEGEYVEW